MVRDAERAHALAPENGAWRPLCCLLQGAGLHLLGERDAARAPLEEGARRGGIVAPLAQVLCLSQLALLAVDDDDWEQAALLASRARAQVERGPLARYPMAALVYATSALVRAHRERVEAAQEDRRQALTLLDRASSTGRRGTRSRRAWRSRARRCASATWSARASLLAEAGAHAARGRRRGARGRPGSRTARRRRPRSRSPRSSGPSALTTAELRVLRMLPTHLSFREMGVRLQVSSNTIKTHAHAVYRKLDACSRSEAVVRARRMGLVDA